jgi:hypothetical protein
VHEEADKFMRLLQLLGVWYEKGSVLVFVDTQVPTTSPHRTLAAFLRYKSLHAVWSTGS